MRFSTAGKAVLGAAGGTISIDGTTPAALSAYIGGYWGWYSTDIIMGPAQPTSADVQKIYQYSISGMAASLVDGSGANYFAAGGAKWAAFLVPTTRTNISGVGPLSNTRLLDVSPNGQLVVQTSYNTGTGLAVYSSAGALLLSLPTVTLTSPYVRLQGNILAYRDTIGWHLINVVTGAKPLWYPRTDLTLIVIPVVLSDGSLAVVEYQSQLTVRYANRAQGYVIQDQPIVYGPDAMPYSPGVVRVGYASGAGEAPSEFLGADVTLRTGANSTGAVVGGSVVWTPGTAYTATAFQVGPAEGSDLAGDTTPPVRDPVLDPEGNGRMSLSWQGWAQLVSGNQTAIGAAVQNAPVPAAPPAGFGIVNVSGQPSIAAFQPNDDFSLASADGSIAFAVNALTKVLDLSAVSSGILTLLTADPASPADNQCWFKRTGVGPIEISFNVRLSGVSYSIPLATIP